MTTNHIDQLAEWWENAEKGTAHAGDTVIRREGEDVYQVYTLYVGPIGKWGDIRILHRAPKPVPAWHDADYVIARTDGKSRRVWANNRLLKRWEDGVSWSHAEDLRDVTPLIEAKVTDEMVKRGRAESMKWDFGGLSTSAVSSMLHAALGIDPSA